MILSFKKRRLKENLFQKQQEEKRTEKEKNIFRELDNKYWASWYQLKSEKQERFNRNYALLTPEERESLIIDILYLGNIMIRRLSHRLFRTDDKKCVYFIYRLADDLHSIPSQTNEMKQLGFLSDGALNVLITLIQIEEIRESFGDDPYPLFSQGLKDYPLLNKIFS